MARPWFPFYFADYSAKTEHLTLVEHGAYLLLMGSYYKTGCKLPANAKQLQRICRAFDPEEVEAMQNVLKQFFVLEDNHYTHTRIDEELEKSNKISEKRSTAAKSRYKKDANAPAKATAIAEVLQPDLHTQSQSQSQSQEQEQEQEQEPKKDSCPKNKFSDADLKTSEFIFNKILELNPNHKKPNLEAWANEMRLMRERDNRTDQQIRDLFTWANADGFWKTNILSPSKLRQQWDKLTIQKNSTRVAAKTNADWLNLAAQNNIEARPGENEFDFIRRIKRELQH